MADVETRTLGDMASNAASRGQMGMARDYLEDPRFVHGPWPLSDKYAAKDTSMNFDPPDWSLVARQAYEDLFIRWRNDGFLAREWFSSIYQRCMLEAHLNFVVTNPNHADARKVWRMWLGLLCLMAGPNCQQPHLDGVVFGGQTYKWPSENPYPKGVGMSMAGDRANLETAATQPLGTLLSLILNWPDREYRKFKIEPKLIPAAQLRDVSQITDKRQVYHVSTVANLLGVRGYGENHNSDALVRSDQELLRAVVNGENEAIVEVVRDWIGFNVSCWDGYKKIIIERSNDWIGSFLGGSCTGNKPAIYGSRLKRNGTYAIAAPSTFNGTGAKRAEVVWNGEGSVSYRADGRESVISRIAGPKVSLQITPKGLESLSRGSLHSKITSSSVGSGGQSPPPPSPPPPSQPPKEPSWLEKFLAKIFG